MRTWPLSVRAMPPAHRVTTAHLGAAYPFMAGPGPGGRGVLIGRDLLGGAFTYDPFELYRQGVLTNPNMVVIGQIGRGKSSFVKSYLWRQSVFGRRAWVVDPKGEYGPLARAWGTQPLRLQPGGSVRLNPLDLGATGQFQESGRAAGPESGRASGPESGRAGGPESGRAGGPPAGPGPIELMAALAEAGLGRSLLPPERTAVDLALGAVAAERAPTLPAVVDALLAPSAESARAIRTDARTLARDGRDVALELRRLVHGDLRGMFDGPTTPGLDLDAPLVVLDLSAVYGSAALGVIMTCATAWLRARLSGHDGSLRLFVVDEAWAILSNLGVARWLQASWKLSRAYGVANIAVLHHFSDLGAAGSDGSETAKLAQGLLADSETAVVYAQPPGEVERSRQALGLSNLEAELLPQLGRGVALWKVGRRSFLVEHHLSRAERRIVDTDADMTGRPGAPSPEGPSGR